MKEILFISLLSVAVSNEAFTWLFVMFAYERREEEICAFEKHCAVNDEWKVTKINVAIFQLQAIKKKKTLTMFYHLKGSQ